MAISKRNADNYDWINLLKVVVCVCARVVGSQRQMLLCLMHPDSAVVEPIKFYLNGII